VVKLDDQFQGKEGYGLNETHLGVINDLNDTILLRVRVVYEVTKKPDSAPQKVLGGEFGLEGLQVSGSYVNPDHDMSFLVNECAHGSNFEHLLIRRRQCGFREIIIRVLHPAGVLL
jgi:hypothetical protein